MGSFRHSSLYIFSKPGQPRLVSGGIICAEPYCEKCTLFCTMSPEAANRAPETHSPKGEWNSYTLLGPIISYPAESRQEAEEQADFYLEKMQHL